MASPTINYTYTDKNGVVRPTAAVAREKYRRENGYEADHSFDTTFEYFGYNDKTDSQNILNTAAQLDNNKAPSISDMKSNVIDKIVSGENSYYEDANNMEKPEYQSQYDAKIGDLMDKILNGEKFSYDIDGDAVYQQYRNIYERNAENSAQNAMGNAMAASGGYANSYAEAAAQQAYNAEMQNVGEMIPEFQAQAYSRFADDRQNDYNQLSMLMNAENMDYGKYRDEVADYNTERDYLLGMGDREQQDMYNQFNMFQSLEEFAFNKEQYYNDQEYQKAVAAANVGDYSLLGDYLGVDTSEAQKWHNITRAAELYSATGMISFLKDAGLDTTELEANLQDEKYATRLTTALAIYEATGDPSKLHDLGIDTSYSDEMLKYAAAKARSSGSGGGNSSGSSSSVPVLTQQNIDKAVNLINTNPNEFENYIESLIDQGYSDEDIQKVSDAAYNALLSDENALEVMDVLGTVYGTSNAIEHMLNLFGKK